MPKKQKTSPPEDSLSLQEILDEYYALSQESTRLEKKMYENFESIIGLRPTSKPGRKRKKKVKENILDADRSTDTGNSSTIND